MLTHNKWNECAFGPNFFSFFKLLFLGFLFPLMREYIIFFLCMENFFLLKWTQSLFIPIYQSILCFFSRKLAFKVIQRILVASQFIFKTELLDWNGNDSFTFIFKVKKSADCSIKLLQSKLQYDIFDRWIRFFEKNAKMVFGS